MIYFNPLPLPPHHFKDEEIETQTFFSKFHSLYINSNVNVTIFHTSCLFSKVAQWRKKKLLPISLNLVLIMFGIIIFFHKNLQNKRIITPKPSKSEFT